MLHYIIKDELNECLDVIHKSFATVAAEFGLTPQNAATNGAFMQYDRLLSEFERCTFMVGSVQKGKINGFASLVEKNGLFELDKLAVLPQARHHGVGRELVSFCAAKAKALGGKKLVLGMIEENSVLKGWYEALGFVSTGTRKFEHLPFTVGFMELDLGKKHPDIPDVCELKTLVGKTNYLNFIRAVQIINAVYDISAEWNGGGKKWLHEYKFRRGGKTLCAFYTQTNYVGCMFVLGKTEQEAFESRRDSFSQTARAVFDGAASYHDGKWLMLDMSCESTLEDIQRLLVIKRRPTRKIVSCCGVVCSACEYYPADCAGCPAIKGKPFWLKFDGADVCGIYDCCVNQRQLEHCGKCGKLPCPRYDRGDPTKSPGENATILKKQLKTLKAL